MFEEWREIDGFPEYAVSSLGRVYSKRNDLYLRPGVDDHGYHHVTFSVRGMRTIRDVHSLVADAFLGDRPPGYQINHINGMKANNEVSNLEWRTGSDNIKHAFKLGLKQPSGGARKTPIRILETGQEFSSQRECARELGISQGGIGMVLHGHIPKYKGMTFVYIENQ